MQKTCVYPNPTSVSFTIEGSVKTLAVYNSFGQEVYSGTARTVDVRGWPAGVYFVRITGNDGEVTNLSSNRRAIGENLVKAFFYHKRIIFRSGR